MAIEALSYCNNISMTFSLWFQKRVSIVIYDIELFCNADTVLDKNTLHNSGSCTSQEPYSLPLSFRGLLPHPVHPSCRRFLSFLYKKHQFQCNVLPFGAASVSMFSQYCGGNDSTSLVAWGVHIHFFPSVIY